MSYVKLTRIVLCKVHSKIVTKLIMIRLELLKAGFGQTVEKRIDSEDILVEVGELTGIHKEGTLNDGFLTDVGLQDIS